jgi:hypothetical protein
MWLLTQSQVACQKLWRSSFTLYTSTGQSLVADEVPYQRRAGSRSSRFLPSARSMCLGLPKSSQTPII